MKLLLLVLATIIWGAGFAGTKFTLTDYSPLWSNAIRFTIAGLLCLPILIKMKSLKKEPKEFIGPLLCALALFLGILTQTFGLKYTTLAKSGFITTFYAIFTPIIAMVIYSRKYRKAYWALVLVALIGIFLLCDMDLNNFNYGDLLTLISAIFFSGHILLLDKYTDKFDSLIELNLMQIFFTGVFSLAAGLIGEDIPSLTPLVQFSEIGQASPITGFIILSVFSSLIAFGIQVIVQKDIPAHIVSLIFLAEAVFASIFGYLFFSEVLSLTAMIGCAMVLVSVAFIPVIETQRTKLAGT